MLCPTIVRGMLRFQPAPGSTLPMAALHDVTGRRVMDLHTGNNDVRRLTPGVYFIRTETTGSRVVVVN